MRKPSMVGEPKALVVPLALLAGAAVGFQPFELPNAQGLVHYAATQVVRATELEPVSRTAERIAAAPREPELKPRTALARLGAESPELRALRRAEAELFPEIDALDLGDALAPVDPSPGAEVEVERAPSVFHKPAPDFLAGLNLPDVPIRRNATVAKYVRFFSVSAEGRKLFASWLKRSGRYRGIIADELAKSALPRDLVAVPFIESGMWPTAVSSAGAVGLWQFMPKTARAYGLTVERGYDERRSIFRSTRAAVEHLKDLHARFRSWDLALASYNAGYARLEGALADNAVDDFWSLAQIEGSLARETVLYVPKILAVMVILNNLSYFGFEEVAYDAPVRASELEVPAGMRLSMLARAAGTSVRELRELNPELVADMVPNRGGPLFVYVPSRGLARARVMLPKLVADQLGVDGDVSRDFDWGRDELAPGVSSRLEGTRPGSPGGPSFFERVAPGFEGEEAPTAALDPGPLSERLRRAGPAAPEPEAERGLSVFSTEQRKSAESAPAERYVVRKGDTLSEIAAAYGVSDDEIRSANGIAPGGEIYVGQELQIRTPKTVDVYHQVTPGDTASELAQKYSTNVHLIQRDNRLRDPSVLPVGRKIRIRVGEGAKSQ